MITVIVPAYNSGATLEACLDSILAQSYKDFELIVVDDGSTDSTSELCDRYKLYDNRIRVIHKENGGVGASRNSALAVADGEYVCFVDSDDTVRQCFLENMLSSFSSEVDLVFSYCQFNRNGNISDGGCPIIFKHTSPWSKLFRMQIIREYGLRFPENMPLGEDAVFLYRYIACAGEIKCIDSNDYIYNILSGGSLTKREYSYGLEKIIADNIDKAIISLYDAGKVTDENDAKVLLWIRASYAKRILNSLYRQPRLVKEERYSAIKIIDRDVMLSMPMGKDIKAWLYSGLLRLGLYRLYDTLRVAVRQLHR